MRAHSVTVMCLGLVCGSTSTALAKGLDQLSEQNPENAPANAESMTPGAPAATGAKTDGAGGTPPASQLSKALAKRLTLATSFGWARASQAKGSWKAGGMSDVTAAYKFSNVTPVSLAATYRFAPLDVTGKVDAHYYRGVLEGHYLGLRADVPLLGQGASAFAGGELGFVKVSLHAVDGLELETKHAKSAAALAVGGGVDFKVLESAAMVVGPRVSAAFGHFTILQLTAAATFAF